MTAAVYGAFAGPARGWAVFIAILIVLLIAALSGSVMNFVERRRVRAGRGRGDIPPAA